MKIFRKGTFGANKKTIPWSKTKKKCLSVIGPKTNPDPKVRKKNPKFRYSGTPYLRGHL